MVSPAHLANDGCFVVADSAGRVRFITDALAGRVGLTREQVIGRTVTDLFPEAREARRVSDDGLVEIRHWTLDGGATAVNLCTVRESTSPEVESVGKITHDLNNVFTIIYAVMETTLGTEGLPPAVLKSLEGAQGAARRGAQMVTKIRQLIGREPREEVLEACSETPRELLGGHERILVASSTKVVRLHLRAVLAYRGYEISEAESTEATALRVKGVPPAQLVITDEAALADAASENLPAIPVLFLCTNPDANETEGGTRRQLRTPFENDALLARIRQMLDAK